jgi:hypothetical protein
LREERMSAPSNRERRGSEWCDEANQVTCHERARDCICVSTRKDI